MSPGAQRFSLPAPRELRDRAERVGQAFRRGRPRARFLAARRSTLFVYLVPCLSLAALISGSVAIVDVALASFPPSRTATLAEVTAALVLAVAVALLVAFRRNLRAILVIHGAAAALSQLAWGVAAHNTGGAASPYLLALPLSHVLFAGVVPAEAWVASVSGVSCYAALLIASPGSPVPIHLVVVASALGSVVLAMARHQRSLQLFMRTERLAAAVARMRRMQEQLVVVEKLEALRVLVGGMAHELNNALAVSIASNQQVLRDLGGNVELARAAVLRGDGGLARIKKTVDRLRRFAMAAEGVLEPADVAAMLDFALESAIGRARSGVVVERKYDPQVGSLEVHVSALAEALYQVARNAVEAMPGGGTIEATVRKEGDRIVLSVADQGQGIPPEQIPHVFDPFYRAEGKGVSKSGLGLSAVYGLISAIGGHIDIKSEVGRGTEIAIVMPARRATIPPPRPSTRPPSP
ncbi:MAG TPA: ATP-binding protein [Polyangiaceae bacterium]|nr:ATP-binding protein [Polyangiaceae bacterium]